MHNKLNTHRGVEVEGEIIEAQQGRDDKFNDKLSCVIAVITI